MSDFAVIYPLALITLLAFAGFGVWQLFRVRRAKRLQEHSALADVGPLPDEERHRTRGG